MQNSGDFKKVDLNNIIAKSIKSNYLLITCFIITFIGFFSYNIIFPKLFTRMLDLVDISNDNLVKTFLPFVIGQGLFCLSDKMYSHAIHQFDKTIINNLLQELLLCYENSYDERDTVLIYSNIIKLLEIKHLIHICLEYLIPVIVITLGTFVGLCQKDIKLGVSLIFIIAVSFKIILSHIGKNIESRPEDFEYKKELNDIVFNIDKILLNNNIKDEMEHFKNYEDNHVRYKIHKERVNVNIKCIIAFMSVMILAIVGSRMVDMYNKKEINKGEFAYYFYLIIVLLQYYDSLSIELNNLLNYAHEYSELRHFFNNIHCGSAEGKPDIHVTKGDIKFTDTKIAYKERPVFDSLNIDIKGGTRIGIYGRNGIGKSTIFKVLLGLLPYTGKITIDEQELSRYNIASLRKHIGFVNQHSMMFNRTLYKNLQYGNKKTREDIDDYIKANGLEEFVSGLGPKGLDTVVSKNGESLSGGQRCILNIIKCILDDKKILLIDEPSNNLDKGMKGFLINILKNLNNASASGGMNNNKTVIVITHDSDLDNIFENKITLSK